MALGHASQRAWKEREREEKEKAGALNNFEALKTQFTTLYMCATYVRMPRIVSTYIFGFPTNHLTDF